MWDERELERPGQVKDRADERDEPPVDGAPTTAQMLPVVTDDLAQVPVYGGDAPTERVSTGSATTPGTAAGDAQAEEKDSNGVSATSLFAGAAAAATSSVIGGQLGVAGTVLGAGLASVVTAVAVTFYSRGLDKGKETVQKAVAKIGPMTDVTKGRGSRNPSDGQQLAELPSVSESSSEAGGSADDSTGEPLTWRQKLRRKRVLYPVVIGAVTFVVGIGAVVLAEQVTDNDISPGTSQISRSLSGSSDSADTSEDGVSGGSSGADSGQQGSDGRQGTGEQGARTDDGADGTGTTGDGSDSQQSTHEQGTDDQGTGGQESGAQGGSEDSTGQDSGSSSGPNSGQGSGSGGSTGSGSSGSCSSDSGSSGSGSSGGGSDANSQGDPGSGTESDSGGSVEAQAG